MKMKLSVLQIVILCFSLANEVLCFPYRSYSPRSVPGRIRASSEPDSIKEYISRYLDMMKQQQQPVSDHQPPMFYNMPEYEPVYQQGYISRRPQINPETIAALLPYLSQTPSSDYAYDYGAAPTAYADDEGTWYDDAAVPEFAPARDGRNENNQEAALLQLFLDHLAGKYSLEDLETLERQAAIEDNTENQLQELMPHKKSKLPPLGTRLTARNILGFSNRQGQKEEPLIVPASSSRKPVFTRNPINVQKWKGGAHKQEVKPVASTHPPRKAEKERNSQKASKEVTKNPSTSTVSSTTTSHTTTTMSPDVQSAYEAFMAYLDQERFLRKTADEAEHSPQKRFVSEPKSLTQQLASLKKTVT